MAENTIEISTAKAATAASAKTAKNNEHNRVRLVGKVSSVGPLKYTPAGSATLDLTVAVPQESFSRTKMGYFPVTAEYALAENAKGNLRIGQKIQVTGQLWGRKYTNRWGESQVDMRVIADRIEKA